MFTIASSVVVPTRHDSIELVELRHVPRPEGALPVKTAEVHVKPKGFRVKPALEDFREPVGEGEVGYDVHLSKLFGEILKLVVDESIRPLRRANVTMVGHDPDARIENRLLSGLIEEKQASRRGGPSSTAQMVRTSRNWRT